MLGLRLGTNKSYKLQMIRSNLVMYIDGKDFLNSPPTSSWRDRSGKGNNAAPSTFAYTTSSGSDNLGGVVFDGISDFCTVINSNGFDFQGGDFTVTFSINNKVLSSYNAIICKRNTSTTNYSFDIRLIGGTSISFNYTTDGVTSKNQTFNYAFAINTKYRICIRRIGAVLKCYINGISIGGTNVANDVIYTSTENVIVGALNSSGTPSNFFNGTLSSLSVYKGKGFTDSEAMLDYNASK